MINVWHELSSKKILNEGCLYEGTHYDKEAAKLLAEVCDIETAQNIIDSLIKKDWVGIFTHTNWIYKFLKPVAKIFVEETKKGKSLDDVIKNTQDILGQFLVYVKDNQDKKDELFNFFSTAHLSDIEKFINDYYAKLQKDDEDKEYSYSGGGYKVIKIDSFEQIHSMFGGGLTGDGELHDAHDTVAYTNAWCHANNETAFDVHMSGGHRLFFVAAKDGWEKIPPKPKKGNPFDAYGLSLIAILTTKDGVLKETSLRWNHLNVTNADHVFSTWGELNRACNQDIQKECSKYFTSDNYDDSLIIKDNIVVGINPGAGEDLEEIVIPDNIVGIKDKVFYACNMKKVQLPSSLKSIGKDSFYNCQNLESINLENVSYIGSLAFAECASLNNITLADNVQIEDAAFKYCNELTNINCDNPDIVELVSNQAQQTHNQKPWWL